MTNFYIIEDGLLDYIDDIAVLYAHEWWTGDYTAQDVPHILTHSTLSFGVIDRDQKKLVGFCRVLSDGFKFAYLHDFIIEPAYRGQGLSRKLLAHVFAHPKLKNLASIELACLPDMVGFYEKFGFSKDYSSMVPMIRTLSPGE